MPSNPSNIMNNDLAIGGNFGAVGNIVTAAGVGASNEVVSYTGLRIASGTPGSPTNGDLTITVVEQLVTLSTSGDTTTVTLPAGSLPAQSVIVGAALRVTTQITGATSTLLTLDVNPSFGPDEVIKCLTALGSTSQSAFPTGDSAPGNFPVYIVDVDTILLVLSGGGDNTPTAGAVRVVLYVASVGALTS
jgi:hypothetical protein